MQDSCDRDPQCYWDCTKRACSNKKTKLPANPIPVCLSPTSKPTAKPTRSPESDFPGGKTAKPTRSPHRKYTKKPTNSPTVKLTAKPTRSPESDFPGGKTAQPTRSPHRKYTKTPTHSPTMKHTEKPTRSPESDFPGGKTAQPTKSPQVAKTEKPTPMPHSGGECRKETGWGKAGSRSNCWEDRLNKWGWTNGPYTISDTPIRFEIWLGAGHCDTSKGTFGGRGTLRIDENGIATISYTAADGVDFVGSVRAYIGTAAIGGDRGAPGQMPIRVSGNPYTVPGTVPENFYFYIHFDAEIDCK